MTELDTTQVPVVDLTEHPRNAREGNVPKIMESLELHGQYRALVVQKSTMFVCAGNHTLKAMRRLGWDTAACHVLDLTDEQALRILLVDNRSSDEATYDYEALADILDELQASGGGLSGTGYDDDDYTTLLADLAADASDLPYDQRKAEAADGVDGDERYTPAWVFEGMGAHFDVDLASPEGGIPYIPADRYLTRKQDALTHDWTGLFAWCNPPFSIASHFGRKWLDEIEEGVWLGPLSKGSEYRVRIMERAPVWWLPHHLEFHLEGGKAETIMFPLFLAGFGKRGELALRNLADRHSDKGALFKLA